MPADTECKEPGRVVPVIDQSRCEGKEECVRVCPYHVFTVRKLSDEERAGLGLLTRFKVFVHGGKQAFRHGSERLPRLRRMREGLPRKSHRAQGRGLNAQSPGERGAPIPPAQKG